jgi:molybdopterin-guanine dinucleotide biosynthesis protein B
MKAIALIGNKKSGKTTLACELADYVRSYGYRVGYAKYSSHGFDLQQSDTSKMMARSQAVVGISQDQSLLMWPGKRYLLDIVPLLETDVLIIEGGRELQVTPRILLPKEEGLDDRELSSELAVASWKRRLIKELPVMHTVQELGDYVLEYGFLLPGLNCGSCGRSNCGQLAREIVRGKAVVDDCQALKGQMSIRVNGQALGLNPFVEGIIAGSIRGMLRQLKGYAPGKIEINLES